MIELKGLQGFETLLNTIIRMLEVLFQIARFVFLTPWGWIGIITLTGIVIFAGARDSRDEFSFSSVVASFTKTLMGLYSHLTTILTGLAVLVIVFAVSRPLKEMSESMKLYREVKTLEATLKNLQTERKLLEVSLSPTNDFTEPQMLVKLKYYAYSPAKGTDVLSGESAYLIEGRKLYLDFGVINFDYSLIEKGLARNIAYPARIYSDTVSPDKGYFLSEPGEAGIPLTFKLDEGDLYLLDGVEYKREIETIMACKTNERLARKMGIRTAYGEAIGIYPSANRAIQFYSTGSGGVVIR